MAYEQSRDRRFKEKHPDSQDAETIGAFQRRDPASFSSFFTIVRRSFSGTAARGGPATIERDASSLREGDAASGATRRRKSPFLKQTHFTRRGRAAPRGRAFHPRCRRRYLARLVEPYGYGKDPSAVTEEEQQKCVSASATVGAFLRYICRRDDKNAKSSEKFGYGSDVVSEEQQAR